MYTTPISTPETTLSSEVYCEPNLEIDEKQEVFENRFTHWIEKREFPQPLETRLEQLKYLNPHTKTTDQDSPELEPSFFLFNNYQATSLFYPKNDISHRASLEILNNGNSYLAEQIAHSLELEAVTNFEDNEQELQKMSAELQEFGFAINKHDLNTASLQILYRPKDDYRVFALELPSISLPSSEQSSGNPEFNPNLNETERSKGKWTGGIAEINNNSVVNHTEVKEGQSIYFMKIEKTKDGYIIYDADGNEIEADNDSGNLYISGQKISTKEFTAMLKAGEVISQSEDNNYKWIERYNLQGDLDSLQEGESLTIEMICDNEAIEEQLDEVDEDDSPTSHSHSFDNLDHATIFNAPTNTPSGNLFATTSDIFNFFELSDLFLSDETQINSTIDWTENKQQNLDYQAVNPATDTKRIDQINIITATEIARSAPQDALTAPIEENHNQEIAMPKKLLLISGHLSSEKPNNPSTETKLTTSPKSKILSALPNKTLSQIRKNNVVQQSNQLEFRVRNTGKDPLIKQFKTAPENNKISHSHGVAKHNNISISNFLTQKISSEKKVNHKSNASKSVVEKISFRHWQNNQSSQESKSYSEKENMGQEQEKIFENVNSAANQNQAMETKTKRENAIQKLAVQNSVVKDSSNETNANPEANLQITRQKNYLNSQAKTSRNTQITKHTSLQKLSTKKQTNKQVRLSQIQTVRTTKERVRSKSELGGKNRKINQMTLTQLKNQKLKISKSKKLSLRLPTGHTITIRTVIENVMERFTKQAEFQNTHNQIFLTGQDGLILNKQIRPLENLTDEICSIVYRNPSVNLTIEVSESLVNFKPQVIDPVLKAKVLTSIDREFKILSPELKIAGLVI